MCSLDKCYSTLNVPGHCSRMRTNVAANKSKRLSVRVKIWTMFGDTVLEATVIIYCFSKMMKLGMNLFFYLLLCQNDKFFKL